MSLNQEARGLREAKETFRQRPGNTLFWKAKYISSNSCDMTAKPLIAFLSYAKVLFKVDSRMLNFSISWSSTMESECIFPSSFVTKCSWFPVALLSNSGSWASNSSAICITISSGVFPPLPPKLTLGWMAKIVYMILFDYWVWYVMLAFSCIPNTSGSSKFGSLVMYYR